MTHPLDMSLSTTGWALDPELLSDIRYELVHSEQFGDCFRIKMQFKNGTDAMFEIEMKDGCGLSLYDALTEAIRTRRLPEIAEKDDA
jgi:hypothetical protein